MVFKTAGALTNHHGRLCLLNTNQHVGAFCCIYIQISKLGKERNESEPRDPSDPSDSYNPCSKSESVPTELIGFEAPSS